jgi:D-amino-acid oxidase
MEIEVPEPIISVNREIIRRMTAIDVSQSPLSAVEGYRFRRDPVRLEVDSFRGVPVVHNYGHGGAGVTLAWSSALKVAELLGQRGGDDDIVEEILGKLIEHCVKL